jgi:hypothetical protein
LHSIAGLWGGLLRRLPFVLRLLLLRLEPSLVPLRLLLSLAVLA